MADWTTKYMPFSSKYESVPKDAPPLKYERPKPFLVERHNCTDPICGLIFAVCLGIVSYVMIHALTIGDPRKIYHGMDFDGNLCGVDWPNKPYVYWCQKTSGSINTGGGVQAPGSSGLNTALANPLTGLDFEHPICVEYCPDSSATTSLCFNVETGTEHRVADYATHAVGERYCFPQSFSLLEKYQTKMESHAVEKYIPLVVSTIHEGWPCLLGVFALAFILSFTYLLVIECIAWLVVWTCLGLMFLIPGLCGGYLVYSSQHGGIDGMPGSGDAETDLALGTICCAISAVFLCICCCMNMAVTRAIKVVEAAASCCFECRTLLFEPLICLTARIFLWVVMGVGIVHLISVGEVRKSKVYRTFTYTDEEKIELAFAILMWIWANDFITACSQYVIANASSRWYFTEVVSGGQKSVGSCILCKSYCNVFFHFGSLAFGSIIIAFVRPFRMIVATIVYAGHVTDNASCHCVTRACGCCLNFFEQVLIHVCKNAFIDMAVTSKPFCAAGTNAARILSHKNKFKGSKAIFANVGATWIFTLSGIGAVTAAGTSIVSFVAVNVPAFSEPSSRYYIQDSMVFTLLAGIMCFFVSLCFMLVLDSVSDTIFLCMAYDEEERYHNPVPEWKPKKREPTTFFESTFMCSREIVEKPPSAIHRPVYGNAKLKALLDLD